MTDIEDIYSPIKKYINDEQLPLYEEIIYQLLPLASISKECQREFASLGRRRDIKVSKINLLFVYRQMLNKNKTMQENTDLMRFLQKKPIRNLSGVSVITLLLSPYPDDQSFSCKENCYYCPEQPDMPRSYLDNEPAVQRGRQHNWDAQLQMKSRLTSLFHQGHKISKLEVIIEGGTFTQFPKDYLERFIRDIYYTANLFLSGEKRRPFTISQEMVINNQDSKCKIVGLSIETRPDKCDNTWLIFLRHVGVTKIQFGVQHTFNHILKKINRGHTFQEAEEGVIRAMDNGFKVCIHLMPDLPGSTPDIDKEMFRNIFNISKMYPDEMKIYPCATTPYTVIKKWHDTGKYKPYTDTNPSSLLNVIVYAMTLCPYWCRIVRVIRDIPTIYIQGGNIIPNLRQLVDQRLIMLGIHSRDIRFRECGRNHNNSNSKIAYFTTKYSKSDYFISCETLDRKIIYGFVRLRIPDKRIHNPIWSILRNRGLIRELHVYGEQVEINEKGQGQSQEQSANKYQHLGIGTKLIKMAERISFFNGCNGTAIISGEGVRNYYRQKLHYNYDISTFEIKNFFFTYEQFIIVLNFILLIIVLIILFIPKFHMTIYN